MGRRKPDSRGYTTQVTSLPEGVGVRVYKDNKLVWDEKPVKGRSQRDAVKEALRWVDKMGADSPMAYASRQRGK